MTDSLTTYSDTLIYNPKLSNLKPIFMPDRITFEPVTAGWYIVLGMLVLLFIIIAFWLFKRYQANAYRRSSARELLNLKPEIEKSNASQLIQKISTILKTTAFKSYPREKVAKLSGTNWQNFLITTITSGSCYKTSFALLDHQYFSENQTNKIDSTDIEKLIDASVKWIRGHRV